MREKYGIHDERTLALFQSGAFHVDKYGKVVGKDDVPANVTKRNAGYIVGLRDHDGVFYVSLPRAVLLATSGLPPEGLDTAVCIDGNKANTLPENLCWGTLSDAAKAGYRAGTKTAPSNQIKGERNGKSKLTDAQREAILYARLRTHPPISYTVLANEYKVSRSAISNLVARYLQQQQEVQHNDNGGDHVVS